MFIQQFLGFSGQWQAILLTVVVLVIGFLSYAPFVILSNKKTESELLLNKENEV